VLKLKYQSIAVKDSIAMSNASITQFRVPANPDFSNLAVGAMD
jgi:hypothetical protein